MLKTCSHCLRLASTVPAEYNSDQFALLCNLLACGGQPGSVLHVRCKNRTGPQNFVTCMRMAVWVADLTEVLILTW